MYSLEVKDDLRKLDQSLLSRLVGELLIQIEDIAFSYDIEEDVLYQIKDCLTEYNVNAEVVYEEDEE